MNRRTLTEPLVIPIRGEEGKALDPNCAPPKPKPNRHQRRRAASQRRRGA